MRGLEMREDCGSALDWEGLVDREGRGDEGDEGSSVEWQCAPQFVLWLVASG
jgi:hypothetical protein